MDRDLVERARSGDQEAFADLVHQVSDTLFGVARRILRDPGLAEDVLQNALVTIWRKLPHLRDADRFDGWAFRILVDACYADAPRNRRWASTVRVLPLERADVADDFDRSMIATSWSGLPPAPARPARGVRPAPPRGPAPRGGGRDARHPGRHRAIATALRHPSPARRLRGEARAQAIQREGRLA